MIPLTITLNIEETPWSDVIPPLDELGIVTRIGRLPRGTASGKSTVTVLVEFPDGRRFAGETTLLLLEAAMKALRAAEDRENPVGSTGEAH